MIVGIRYDSAGARYIANISFKSDATISEQNSYAEHLTAFYDEVYIIDIDNTHEDFINEIVTKGCRIGV